MIDPALKARFHEKMRLRRSESTAKTYGYGAAAFEAWRELTQRAYDDPYLLRNFADHLVAEKYEPDSVGTYVKAVKCWFEHLREEGGSVVEQKPAVIRRKKTRIRPQLDAEGLKRYRQGVEQLNEPWRTALLLEPCLGARVAELVTIKLADIAPGDPLHVKLVGKGDKERIVPMLDTGKPILVAYLRGYQSRTGSEWLFPSPLNKKHHIAKSQLRAYCKLIREKHGLGRFVTPHSLRRVYLTAMARGGLDPWTMADLAGHASTRYLDRYVEPSVEAAAQRARDLPQIFGDDT